MEYTSYQQREGRPVHLVAVMEDGYPGTTLCGAQLGKGRKGDAAGAATCTKCIEQRDEAEGGAVATPKRHRRTAAERLEDERKVRVAKELKRLQKEDAQKLADHEKAVAANRKALERKKEEQQLAETKAKARAAAAAPAAAAEPKAARQVAVPDGMEKCPGSGANVEERKLTVLDGKALSDGDPWDWRGKKVTCPDCGKRSGIYVTGKRKGGAARPDAYKVDPHYRKLAVAAAS